MSEIPQSQRQRLGALLVFLQFFLLLLLVVLTAPALLRGEARGVGAVLALLSLLLGGWTLAHNRLGNFNIRPTPKTGGVLVTTGPYRWIRHPMYSAVLLLAAAMAVSVASVLGWTAWAALALVLWVKALLEERWVAQVHGAYADYCTRSKRLIPWIL